MITIQAMSAMHKDFVINNLRTELNRMRGILNVIEMEDEVGCDYVHESLKEIEDNLKQIRKVCVGN